MTSVFQPENLLEWSPQSIFIGQISLKRAKGSFDVDVKQQKGSKQNENYGSLFDTDIKHSFFYCRMKYNIT